MSNETPESQTVDSPSSKRSWVPPTLMKLSRHDTAGLKKPNPVENGPGGMYPGYGTS